MLADSRVLQAARDGGSGGGASGAGAKVEASRRTASQPHDSDTEEEGEWEPGAYGLVDVPQKRSLYRPPAWMSGGTAAPPPARSVPSAARAAGRTAQPPSPALPPTPTRRTAREGPEPAGGSTRAAGHNSSGGSARRPAQPDGQLHPGSPAGFPFAWLVPSPNDPPQLRLFPGQLRATSSKRLGTAGGALLIQPTDSSSSRASSHGSEHMVAERSDSAAFGSEISFKGDD